MAIGVARPTSGLFESHPTPRMGVPRRLKVVARLALVLMGVLTPLLLLETALRLAGPILPGDYQTATFTVSSTLVGRQNKPNSAGWRRTDEFTTWVRINSKGLRGPEIPYDKPADTFRVLVLGDSFTFAMQVAEEQTFVAQLAERLNRSAGGLRVETINAGADRWSTANEYAWLVTEGYKYQPDLVLLMYFVGNDPGDNADLVRSADRLDQLRLGADRTPLAAARERLSSLSVAYSVFEQGVPAKLIPPIGDGEAIDDKAGRNEPSIDVERKDRGWAISEALFGRLREFTAARGAKLAVVGIPARGQITDLEESAKPLRAIGARVGVPIVDLLEPLRALPRNQRERLYFPRNKHWTPDGHTQVARTLARDLPALGLAPGGP